jgi:putative heme-binding domain-containing protein
MRSFPVLGLLAFALAVSIGVAQSPPATLPASTAKSTASNAAADRRANKQKRGRVATGLAIGDNQATPVDRIKVAKGFKVELLYSVPAAEQGSWVNLCVDDKGRIIASDQYGGLFRFVPPPPGQQFQPASVEKVPAEIRAVNGMVWAFGALYVAVNDYEGKMPNGLYRIADSDGDDRLDEVQLLRGMDCRGDHGVHALLKSPDGQSLFFVTGNGTKPTAFSRSRVPLCWGEDHLLPRMPDGRGHKRDVLAPGGIIYRVSPDGNDFEVFSAGYRNIFDAAVNRDGELFTYDADMEYDFNTSWYRPTRVCHAVSGSEFGWRNGAGKRPEWYPDNLPPVINIGPGSPTGIAFGYGAKFPAKYQEALFILDWSWGKMYAVHLTPQGASYTAQKEEFLSGAPLPVTDVVIHPADGAMYFTIGGRQVQSGLYRVTYVGTESTAPAAPVSSRDENRLLRQQLEAYHGRRDPEAVAKAWPYLGHADRFVRWAARTAIEHQEPATWVDRALGETDPACRLEALLALVRVTGIDPFHRKPTEEPVDPVMREKILAALDAIDWSALSHEQQVTLVRTHEIVLNRFGRPDDATIGRLVGRLDPFFPAATRELNWLLCETLVYLQSPTVAAKALSLIESAATQEEQIEYARSLRMLKAGWTCETRTAYLRWFLKAASFRGGASFDKFIEFIRTDALATLTENERVELADVLAEKPVRTSPLEGLSALFAGRPQHAWTLEELSAAAMTDLRGRNFVNGRKMFGATACFTCHRFANEGGMTGPDLTTAGRRYSPHDLLDQILHPSKEINEQFVPVIVRTSDGQIIQGLIVNLNGDSITVNSDPTDPNKRVSVDRKEVLSIEPSKVSPMPTGLLNPLTKDEILDLVAYVLAGGDQHHEFFEK